MAGVFFAFSSFVMPAFDRLPPAAAIAAMQSTNVTAVRPLFMTALFGTALAVIAVVILALLRRDEYHLGLLLLGAGLYLIGAIALTAFWHVPLNNGLDLLDPNQPDAAARWHDFYVSWTPWNHLRAISSLAAAAALISALLRD